MAVVVLCNVTRSNDLNLDTFSIIARKSNFEEAGSIYRARLDKGKRLGYTKKSGIDRYGRVWSKLQRGDRTITYYVCTEQVAEKTLLI